MKQRIIYATIAPAVVILPLVLFWRPLHVWTAKAGGAEPASPLNTVAVTNYDADPEHLWNRLYAALYVRSTADGHSFGQDDLDPYLWEDSTYLLREPRYQQAVGLLNEFLDSHGENLVAQPLKRAKLQHDLWAVFDWLADPYVENVSKTTHFGVERRALRTLLAPAIRRLALSAEQIDQLPDNFRAAVASESYPTMHDPAHTERAFLPPDLFDEYGPWVHFQTGGGKPYPFATPTAMAHNHFVGGRSAFFVFMNLPGGRQSTLDFMQELNTFPKPNAAKTTGSHSARGTPPRPPVGTKFALVRQMMLIDDKGAMRPTRLIESLQIRIVNSTDAKESDFYEFTIHRKELFASDNGLRAATSDQVTLPVFNHTHDPDVFELPNKVRTISDAVAKRMRKEPVTENLRSDCVSCHTRRVEIISTNEFFGQDLSPEMIASERANEVGRVVRLKGEKYQWGLLQGLTEVQVKK